MLTIIAVPPWPGAPTWFVICGLLEIASMPTVGILGANGQVGTETCLFLRNMAGVTVVPICRSNLASAFLRSCGLRCRIGSVLNRDEAHSLLKDCDLVADFSLPLGLSFEMRRDVDKTVRSAMSAMPSGARFVYISSEMAFGMSYESEFFRKYSVGRTTYGVCKRHAERLSIGLGRKTHRQVYVLRLSQVHGELQNVSLSIERRIHEGATFVPHGLSDTVFAFTVAEALSNIAAGKESPGIYTVVSSPQWTWAELHGYYAQRRGIDSEASVLPPAKPRTGPAEPFRRGWASMRREGMALAVKHHESISAYWLRHFPALEMWTAARYRRGRAVKEIREMLHASVDTPYRSFAGTVLGRRLTAITDSRITMRAPMEEVRRVLCGLRQKSVQA